MTTAYTVTNLVPMTALPTTTGVAQTFLVNASNPADATFAPDGLAAAPVYGPGGQLLQGGEMVANGVATLKSYIGSLLNSGALCWVLSDCTSAALQVAPASQSRHSAQLAQALMLSGAQCRLSATSSVLTLARVGAGLVYIPGYGIATIPSAGVTLTAAGLTASTLYYIYLYMNGSTLTLEASTTSHATDATTGIQIKNGDNTRLFVGMEYATATMVWAALARSWYNDQGFSAIAPLTSNASTSSTTYVAVSASLRQPFLLFAGEKVSTFSDGGMSSTGAGYSVCTSLAFDGTTPVDAFSWMQNNVASQWFSYSVSAVGVALAEGYHYVQVIGHADGGATASWVGTSTPGTRTSLKVMIPPGARI
jgi:hypothetical protein